MNVSVRVMQINQISVYNLSAFPDDRVRVLVSELNVHYEKIKQYLEAEVSGEKLNVEVIDSLAKLNEINRLGPCRIGCYPNSGDFRFVISLLESVVALLTTGAGHQSTRSNLLKLGWSLLNKLYSFSYEELIDSALLYHWLNKKGLVRSRSICFRKSYYENDSTIIRFQPSDDELNEFFSRNQQRVFEYMVFEMASDKEESDPFSNPQAADFYHYYRLLSQFEIL